MTVYSVEIPGEVTTYFETQREALTFARKCTPEEGYPIVVERVTLIPMNKAAIVRLLNVSGKFVDSSAVIRQFAFQPTQETQL